MKAKDILDTSAKVAFYNIEINEFLKFLYLSSKFYGYFEPTEYNEGISLFKQKKIL